MGCIRMVGVVAVLLAALVTASPRHQHHEGCMHDAMKLKHVPVMAQTHAGVSSEREFEQLSTTDSAFANMRVKYFFDIDGKGTCKNVGDVVSTYSGSNVTCTSNDLATAAKLAYWHRIMTDAASWFSNALRVVPVSGSLQVPVKCGDLPTNGSIPNTDFIIYVTAVPAVSSGTLAWAFSCAKDGRGRSIASHVNIVPKQYPPSTPHKYTLDRSTFIHEIAHALGFSGPFFQDGSSQSERRSPARWCFYEVRCSARQERHKDQLAPRAEMGTRLLQLPDARRC